MASYYRRKNGTYCVRISNGIKNGKQEMINTTYKPPMGATKAMIEKGVKEFANLLEASVHNGLYVPGSNGSGMTKNAFGMTVESFIESCYFNRISIKFSPNTVRFYRMVCEQFILPSYGAVRLREVTPQHLQAFIDFLASPDSRMDEANGKPLSASSVKRYATVFSSVMSEACKAGYIQTHPFKHAVFDYPKISRSVVHVYDEEEAKAFFEKLKHEPLLTRGILSSALMLGLRRAEIVALKWEDVNFEKGYIRICRSAFKAKGEVQGVKLPKSQKSIRTVFFPVGFGELLKEIKAAQEKWKKNSEWNDKDFIFTDEQGNMVSLYAPTELCADFEKRNGLRHLKLHGLRHTCASLMVSNGVDPETVKSMLGHDSLRTTDIYLHPYDSNMKQAADLIGDIMEKGRRIA